MAAIIGLDTDKIKEICAETANMTNQCVQAVNFNCPGQIVIAGATEAVHKACDRLKEAGANAPSSFLSVLPSTARSCSLLQIV